MTRRLSLLEADYKPHALEKQGTILPMTQFIQKPMQHLPENAVRTFSGVLFDVYQWPQVQFDGSTKTFEKLVRADTGTVIAATSEGKIVMTIQEQPGSRKAASLPGGKIEHGEKPLDAVKRELLEETGYEAEDWTLWQCLHPHEKIDYTAYTYLARNAHRVKDATPDEGEKISLKLLDWSEFLLLMLDPNYRDDEVALGILRAKAAVQSLADLQAKLGLDK
jgi:8-oxo-dGTP pyrophosphatase MutT (NUDIX family)